MKARSARSALGGLTAALLVAANLSGCGLGAGGESIQVAVVWSGAELEHFRTVMEGFEDETGIDVDILSTGDDIDGFLRARARAGNLPDVAVLSRPGLIDDYAGRGWLEPLDDALADRYAAFWEDLGRNRDPGGPLYGAWIKGSYKSLFWYQPSELTDAEVPTDWTALQELVADLARPGDPAPLAVGAADQWVLTDWFENLLLAHSTADAPNLYDDLAAGQARWCEAAVLAAFEDLARLWNVDGAFTGGGERARLTQFDESVVQVAAAGEGVMLQGSEFVQALTAGVLAGGDGETAPLLSFDFPSPTSAPPVLLGGDVAVVMAGSRLGDDLVEWLTRPDSFTSWIEAGGYLSPVLGADGEPPTPADAYTSAVAQPATEAQFDLSDQLEGEVGGRIGPVLEWLFSQAATGSSSGDAELEALASTAAGRLNEAAGGEAC